mgnify:CR=1 FL=1
MVFVVSLLGMLVLHLLELYVPAPARLPDLYAALFSIYGAGCLCVVYVVCVSWMWRLPTPLTAEKFKVKSM